MTNAGNMEEIWKEFEAASVKNQTKVNAQQRKFPGEVKPAGKLDFELETFRKSIEKCTLPEIKDIQPYNYQWNMLLLRIFQYN